MSLSDRPPPEAPTFSVIVPASGRASLRRTLRRLRSEDAGDIEVVIVSDGSQPISARIALEEAEGWPAIRYHEGPAARNWGNEQRMVGMEYARGRYLMFIDDDDLTRRGAFALVREAVQRDPERIHLFRLKLRNGKKIWERQKVELGQVSTQMIIVPNRPGSLGTWLTQNHYWSDVDFVAECMRLQGEPVWHPQVIAHHNALHWWQIPAWLPRRGQHLRNRAMLRTRAKRLLKAGRRAR